MSAPVQVVLDGTSKTWNEFSSATFQTLTLTTHATNEVLVLSVMNTALAPTNFRTVVSVTGGGLTWTKYASNSIADGAYIVSNPTGHGGMSLEVWWAYSAAILTSAVFTVTFSGQPSKGLVTLLGFSGCATPSAPWDTNASLPVMGTGTPTSAAPTGLLYSTTARPVLPLYFSAVSAEPGIQIKPATPWVAITSGGATGGTYPETELTPWQLVPVLPNVNPPVAYGCDPRTGTSLTATWDAVPPVNYPIHANEAVNITNSTATARFFVGILGALVGTPLGNTVSYQIEYRRNDNATPYQYLTTSATSAVLTGLDLNVDYRWHVRTQDSAKGNSPYSSPFITCLMPVAPVVSFAMDDVVVMTEGGLSSNLISLRWSDDRGHSFGNPVTQSIGEIGEYGTSLQWQRLAYARDRVWEISWTAGCEATLQGCWVDVLKAQS